MTKKEDVMAEPVVEAKDESKGKASNIIRIVIQWTILGLLAFTCIMAAIRKFG
jgi:hypothetical protein